jgi:hypothetical protein
MVKDMDYTSEELSAQLKRDLAEGESWHIEFKAYNFAQLAAQGDGWKDDLAHEFAALGSVGGKIYIGVDDNGVVLGVNGGSHQQWQERLFERTAGKIKPRVNWKSYPIDNDSKSNKVIMIELLEGEPLYYVGGKPYVREGTKSRPAEPEDVKARFKKYFESTQALVATDTEDPKKSEQSEVVSWITNTLISLLVAMNLYEQKDVNPQLDRLKSELEITQTTIDAQLGTIKRAFGKESSYYKSMELIYQEILAATSIQFMIDGGRSWNAWKEHLKKIHSTATELLSDIKSSITITIEGLEEQEEDARDETLRWLDSIGDSLSKFVYEAGDYVRTLLRLHHLLWLTREHKKAEPYKQVADEIEKLSWARTNTDYMEIDEAIPELRQKLTDVRVS